MRAAVLAVLAACGGTEPTLDITLATAPGSSLLSSVDRVRLTLTNPPAVFEAQRTASGLDLAFEIDAVEDSGAIWIEGFDASDVPIVVGQSPPFALSGTDSSVVIYVAPRYSILPAPVALEPARSHIGATDVLYGAVLAGGLDADGAPSASMAIYNAYNHGLLYGEDMPVRRAGATLAANDSAGVYVLGGADETGTPTSTLYRFQTNVPPDGTYADLGVHPGLESTGQRAAKIGTDAFFVTGAHPAVITSSTIAPITSFGDVTSATAARTVDNKRVAAFLREGIYNVGMFAVDGTLTEVDFPTTEPGRVIVATAPGTAIVVGGATQTVFVVDLAVGTIAQQINTLSTKRRSPAIAATSRHIVIAGGTDDNNEMVATADILDATTLALVATVPVAPRANTIALPLPNDQVMIVGGDDVTNLIELFTPPVP